MPNPTERLVLFGSYAHSDAPGVYAYSFNTETGALTRRGAHEGITSPSFVAAHPNGQWVYAVGELGVVSHGVPGEIHALEFDKDAGTFREVNQKPTEGDWPCHLELDSTGKWIFAVNYGTGSMTVFPILTDGSLGERSDHVQHHGSGPHPTRQEGPHAHSTTLTPDNRFAIVADLGLDQLVMYAFDSDSGTLHEHARVATRPAAGPRHLVFHPNGRVLYAANELANTVAVYDYDAANGTLTERQVLDTLPPDAGPNTVADIHISQAADRVYVSNRGFDSIAVYGADADGSLTRLAVIPSGGKTPRNFALAPGGKFILVAHQDTGDVTVLPLNVGAEEIGAQLARVSIPGACCIKFIKPA